MTIFPTLWYVGTHQMGIARYLHSSVVLGSKLYVMGGLDETQSLQATMYVTDQERKYQFEVCPRMLYPVCRPAVAAFDKKIYVFGAGNRGQLCRGNLDSVVNVVAALTGLPAIVRVRRLQKRLSL